MRAGLFESRWEPFRPGSAWGPRLWPCQQEQHRATPAPHGRAAEPQLLPGLGTGSARGTWVARGATDGKIHP